MARQRSAFPIVGIGASAGGLEAFSELLRHLPEKTDMAFVLVQHLDPTHGSVLGEILSRTTKVPVKEVADGEVVHTNHIYVIPANTNMIIKEGVLRLVAREPKRQHMPIDHFLNSLANDRASKEVGKSIFGRLKALAYAQDLVIGMGESGVLLSKLVAAELGSFAGRFSLAGPDVSLDAGVTQNLALVLHELTTNAIKYGSLSAAAGTITINSSLGSQNHLILTWAEHGGPRVSAPQRIGFGSQLIGQAFSSDSRSRAAVTYNSEGLVARFEIPLKFVHGSEVNGRPAERRGESSPSSLRGLSVLIVEDEVLIALEAEAELLRAGTGAMTRAHSIEEAERCIASSPFDVAILDANLNGRPSFPLADLLADRGIAFVFASGYSHLDGLPERWRGVPLVHKPYSSAELVAAIDEARRHLHAQ